jgi:AcrR family transcriptional regulator
VQESTSPGAGRPRADVTAEVFAATLRSVHEFGYAGATMDRIAVAAGVAKTTLYRRWPSKGALITACLVDAFGPAPLLGEDRDAVLANAIRWGAERIAEPGVGAAFAGVFTDAVSDPALRGILWNELQAPYLRVLQDALGESEQRVRFVIDVAMGTLLHRMGISGEPMAADDVEALIAMVRGVFR